MSNPQIKVFVGVDMAKGEHYAQAITTDGLSSFHTDGYIGYRTRGDATALVYGEFVLVMVTVSQL